MKITQKILESIKTLSSTKDSKAIALELNIGWSTVKKYQKLLGVSKDKGTWNKGRKISTNTSTTYVKNYRKKIKQRAIEFLGSKCSICSYNKCIEALEFHHIDPTQKEFSISGKSISWSKIEKELKKCILVCCRCHREIHSLQALR